MEQEEVMVSRETWDKVKKLCRKVMESPLPCEVDQRCDGSNVLVRDGEVIRTLSDNEVSEAALAGLLGPNRISSEQRHVLLCLPVDRLKVQKIVEECMEVYG